MISRLPDVVLWFQRIMSDSEPATGAVLLHHIRPVGGQFALMQVTTLPPAGC
ncbi:hypothetical Protein YC6258_01598 [Gynuella sunshinyii YC6258]|uniref:Uncharacterized protein n=1 Tax=Gynuella sunshinyii YC6258 TaxID=1445510 RepID=A0A0C5VHC0_9GAMM|nr:hypothetical Protein YC6258_01598 [Gynuella sunshinyii YC6258]